MSNWNLGKARPELARPKLACSSHQRNVAKVLLPGPPCTRRVIQAMSLKLHSRYEYFARPKVWFSGEKFPIDILYEARIDNQ